MFDDFFGRDDDYYNLGKYFCDDCLWYCRDVDMCGHYREKGNPSEVNSLRFCEVRFDVRLDRDYDGVVVDFCRRYFPDMICVDDYGDEYI